MRRGSDSGEKHEYTFGLTAFALWWVGLRLLVANDGFRCREALCSFFSLFSTIQLTSASGSESTAGVPTHLLVSWTNMADLLAQEGTAMTDAAGPTELTCVKD